MTQKIKAILEKHISSYHLKLSPVFADALNNAIIEVCEEQKKECAENTFKLPRNQYRITNSKNIAKP